MTTTTSIKKTSFQKSILQLTSEEYDLEKNIINNDSSLNTKEKISMLRNSMIFHLFIRIGVNYIYEYISKFRETPDTLHTNKAAEMADISSIL